MPRGDRSGPNGMGSMTGRGSGFCNGFNAPGYMNSGAGFGRGRGRGRGIGGGQYGYGAGYGAGRGYGLAAAPYAVPMAPVEGYSKGAEKGYIENEVSFLKNQLKALEGRLADMQEDE
jgi:Family of unknown function (DUF5320)